ncbi:solute carrier family 23 member 1-like [Daphnia pulicaria]|uniref:solute carrier family 23 member 1-like n=1 Tax=Daphnia pulicaria TaxID=35523 RepID=UPI001EEC54DD|nr:solute carrier family 23 member 1-like [Daphnia pulicaria]
MDMAGQTNAALDIDEEVEMDQQLAETLPAKKTDLITRVVASRHALLYSVDDVPPWHLSCLLGFQHYLMMFGGTISVPFILTPALCIEENDPVRSAIVSTIIFVSGIITLLQCTLGVRLPIVQGGTFAFLVPTFAILNLPEWKCPAPGVMANMTYEDKTELWQLRMREVQGAIVVASVFQFAIGVFGIVGLILRFITPLTIAPAIVMVGLSLFGAAGNMAGKHWGISGLTIFLVIVFSQYLKNVKCPLPTFRKGQGWGVKKLDIFTLLPVLLSIVLVWTLCAILTVSDAFQTGSPARTDNKINILYEAPWFRFPYPCQWGLPTVSVAAVFGMLAGVLASAIESIGDYYACARLAGARPPPVHAMNRGIAIEGLGCILAGLWGSGNGTTSYSENIGAIGVTKVGSRRVIQAAALMMMVFGVLSKFGALFITIPEPIIGGIFCVLFGMIAATGLANLQFIDLNSSRNLLVLGFSIFFSLVLSQWMKANPGAINSGSQIFDQIVTVLMSTSMFTAGVLGFFLDNTIPGTDEERGLTKWLAHPDPNTKSSNEESAHERELPQCTYDIPLITPWLKRQEWAAYLPFLPSYRPEVWSGKTKSWWRRENKCEDKPNGKTAAIQMSSVE